MEVSAVTVANCASEFPQQAKPDILNEVITATLAEKPSPAADVRASYTRSENETRKSFEPNQITLNEASQISPDTLAPPAPPPLEKSAGKYRLLRTIGKGNFAKVKLAIHIATGIEVAIKIVNKTTLDAHLLNRLKREMNIMKNTNHPNIVKLLEVIENEDVMCLVMEYASGGEIFDYLVAHGRVREKEARDKFRQLLSAIQYCHSKRIVHRDLKAENILLDPELNVKVADFGLANTFESDQRLNTFCGSPPYAAPELFLGVPYYGPGVDIWSLGVLLFTLVIGHLPFDARDLRELRNKIIGLNYTIPKGAVTPECEALLRKMLVLDPKDRSSLKSLMQDKWVNNGCETLRPYKEPQNSVLDENRVKIMESMGYTRSELEASVLNSKFDHIYATYHLLQSSVTAVSDVAKPEHDSGIASPTTANADKPATEAIGRFTVAPSSAGSETRVSPASVNHQQPKLALEPVSEAQPRPNSDTPYREHHSLTSTLPSALRKAFAQVGRTLGTGGGSPSIASTETNSRTFSHGVSARGSLKSAARTSEGKHAITAAPVPIVSTRKSHLIATQARRASPVSTAPVPRSATLEGSPTPSVTSGSKPQGVSTTTHVTSQGKRTPRSSPPSFSQRTSHTRPAHQPMAPLTEDPQQRKPAISENGKVTFSPNIQVDGKSVTSSTSSDSPSDVSSRGRSTASVQDVMMANELQKKSSTSTPMSAANVPPNFSAWSPDSDSYSVATKSSHTVQGTEAHTLQNEVRRMHMETAKRPALNPAEASLHTMDGSHGNTWSRGVFKALGGLFGPAKLPEASMSGSSSAQRGTPGPRVVRFPFSVDTTSSKPADELLSCVVRALELTPGCRYMHHEQIPFLLRCSWASDRPALRSAADMNTSGESPQAVTVFDASVHRGERDDPLHFELEVCQLPRLHLRGVRVKRIRGSAIQFREVAKSIMKTLRL